jgi:hypothetical protein
MFQPNLRVDLGLQMSGRKGATSESLDVDFALRIETARLHSSQIDGFVVTMIPWFSLCGDIRGNMGWTLG